MDVRAFGASGIPLKPKSTLFSDEEGGVEPGDLPISPKMAAQFGFQSGTITPDTDNAAARAGVAARAYKPTLQDPGMERRAAFGMDPAGNPARTPTRQESAEDDAYVAAQVAPVQNAEVQRRADVAQARTDTLADLQLTDAQRSAAFRQAFQEMTGREYSPEAVKEQYQREVKDSQTQAYMDAMHGILAEEEAALQAIDAQLPMAPDADPSDPTIKATLRTKLQRQQDARYKASQKRAAILSDFTKDAVKGESPEESAKALESMAKFYGIASLPGSY